jgi:hypothetical protein
MGGIKHSCQAAETRDKLTQEFEPLSGIFGGLERQSRDVAARVRKACDKAAADRIATIGMEVVACFNVATGPP